jgi:hypothetical protein
MKLVDDAFAEADLSNLRKLAELAGKPLIPTRLPPPPRSTKSCGARRHPADGFCHLESIGFAGG